MGDTIFHLIRHGENDVLKHSIAGRQAGVHLNANGRRQADALASALYPSAGITRIVCSPLERAQETAAPFAAVSGLRVESSAALLEVDFAGWTGMTFEELDQIEEWRKWNTFRSGNRVPGGESMLEVQSRVVAEIERIRRQSAGGVIALFSHGDPIRAAILWYLGMPLDFINRLKADPGSICTLAINDWSPQLLALNRIPAENRL